MIRRFFKLFLAAQLFHATAFAGLTEMDQCTDSLQRPRMSLLEAALWGPLYSSNDYDFFKHRFAEISHQIAQTKQAPMSLLPPQQGEYYLKAALENRIRTRSLINGAQMAAQMLYDIYEPTALKGSYLNLQVNEISRRATNLLCNAGCATVTREEIRKAVDWYVVKLTQYRNPRRNLSQIAEDMNTDVEGLNEILQHNYEEPIDRYTDYHSHLMAISEAGVGLLFQMEAVKSAIGPSPKDQDFACEGAPCQVPLHRTKLTRYEIGKAAGAYYNMILNFGLRHRPPPTSNTWDTAELDKKIVNYYRTAPLAVVQVYREYPELAGLHCEYLEKTLNQKGQEQAILEDGNGAAYLAPMTIFWLVGLGGAILTGGLLLPITFTLVTLVTVADIGWRTYQINRQQSAADEMLFQTLNQNNDEYGREQLRLLQERIAEDRASRDEIIAYQAASLGFGSIAFQIWGRGFTLAMAGAKHLTRVYSKVNFIPHISKWLRAKSIYTEADFKKWYRFATTAERAEMLKMLNSGYERSAMAGVLALKEVSDAWFVYPVVWEGAGGELESRPDF